MEAMPSVDAPSTEPMGGPSSNGDGPKRFLSRTQILDAGRNAVNKFASVDIPEWGGTIRFKRLTQDEHDAFTDHITSTPLRGPARVRLARLKIKLIIMTAVDGAGDLLFSAQAGDEALLAACDAVNIGLAFDAASAHNGLSAKVQEEEEKNLEGVETAGF